MSSISDGNGQFYAIPSGGNAATECDHAAVHGLGSDGGLNRYFECPNCGSVLVREGAFAYGDGANDDLGEVDPHMGDLLEDIAAHHDGRRSPYEASPPETVFDRLSDAVWRFFR